MNLNAPTVEPQLGTVHLQWVKCGKQSCRCARGTGHGPYYYHFVREQGRLRKRYVRAGLAEQVKAGCAARQLARIQLQEGWNRWRELNRTLQTTWPRSAEEPPTRGR